MKPLEFLPASEVLPEMLAAAARRFPFPRGLDHAYKQGVLRFAMIGEGGAAVLHAAVTDSAATTVALTPLREEDAGDYTSLHPFEVIGDGSLPVGLADADPNAVLMLVRGAEDIIAARDVWPHSSVAVVGMLRDLPINPDALELMRGRYITVVDFGGEDGAFAFGGWREQLRGIAGLVTSLGANVPRFPAGELSPSVGTALRVRAALQRANLPVEKLTFDAADPA